MGRILAQKEGIDYKEIFSPVVKLKSILMLLVIVIQFDLVLEQMNVKTTFLYSHLEEKIYMKQLEGYIQKGEENKMCLLKKSFYGLKQSPRQWYKQFDSFMIKIKYNQCEYDSCVYFKQSDDPYICCYMWMIC